MKIQQIKEKIRRDTELYLQITETSQRQFAAALKINYSMFSDWLRGSRGMPDEKLDLISEVITKLKLKK